MYEQRLLVRTVSLLRSLPTELLSYRCSSSYPFLGPESRANDDSLSKCVTTWFEIRLRSEHDFHDKVGW
jgi:hypothetical protein